MATSPVTAPATTTVPRAVRPSVPLVVAHRGASDAAPENTVAAVRLAVGLGADLVEVDVRRTRDGALVVVHDATLARTTDAAVRLPGRAPWRVEDLLLEEVRRLDAGSWHSRRHRGERVPTLDEVLRALRGTGTGLLLELKDPTASGTVGPVAAALAGCAPGEVVVQSFDVPAMRRFKALRPDLDVGVLGRPRGDRLREVATWADLVNPSYRRTDTAYVEELHRLGLRTLVWTVDGHLAMRRMLRAGVDGVISNRTTRLRRLVPAPARTPSRPRPAVARQELSPAVP